MRTPAPSGYRKLAEFLPRWPVWVWLAFCATLALLPVREALRYDRELVSDGEYWRLWTANLVHSNGIHYLLNAASVFVQAILFRNLLPMRVWVLVSLWCAVGNTLGMHWFAPTLGWYVGMSGALYGTAIVGALALLMNKEWWVGGILTAYLTGRIAYEQNFKLTDDLSKWIETAVAIDAHLWGLISGYIAAAPLAWWWFRGRRDKSHSLA
jgi:rhomboid family GlyGly-CTERM serine protease